MSYRKQPDPLSGVRGCRNFILIVKLHLLGRSIQKQVDREESVQSSVSTAAVSDIIAVDRIRYHNWKAGKLSLKTDNSGNKGSGNGGMGKGISGKDGMNGMSRDGGVNPVEMSSQSDRFTSVIF